MKTYRLLKNLPGLKAGTISEPANNNIVNFRGTDERQNNYKCWFVELHTDWFEEVKATEKLQTAKEFIAEFIRGEFPDERVGAKTRIQQTIYEGLELARKEGAESETQQHNAQGSRVAHDIQNAYDKGYRERQEELEMEVNKWKSKVREMRKEVAEPAHKTVDISELKAGDVVNVFLKDGETLHGLKYKVPPEGISQLIHPLSEILKIEKI